MVESIGFHIPNFALVIWKLSGIFVSGQLKEELNWMGLRLWSKL